MKSLLLILLIGGENKQLIVVIVLEKKKKKCFACSKKFALSNRGIVLFVAAAVCMEASSRHYFWSKLCMSLLSFEHLELKGLCTWKVVGLC